MTTKYPSIETIFVRDPKTNRLDFDRIRIPEFQAVNQWLVSEKVDGTNIRAVVTLAGIEVKGRTDNATLNPKTVEAVLKALPPHDAMVPYFREMRGKDLDETWSVTWYGEAYGPGIQKGGVYAPEQRFRAFDLKLGLFWTSDSEMRQAAHDLSIPTVPFVGLFHSRDLPRTKEALTAMLPFSEVALMDNGRRDVEPEGIVAKPVDVLLDRYGNRLIWKITHREWKKGMN